jgi:Mrp family chromosome partitioning ATPase
MNVTPGDNGSNGSPMPGSNGRRSRSGPDLTAYHRLVLQLHYDLPRGQEPRSALLATPVHATGIAAHGSSALATCMAEELNRPILLVDASGRGAELSDLLDAAQEAGLVDLLEDPQRQLTDYVLPTSRDKLDFLPAGQWQGPPSPDHLEPLLSTMQEQYDFVVFCGGALMDNPMSLAVAPHAGCVLMLVVEKQTSIDDLDAAHDALSFCHARKAGVVLTEARRGGWPHVRAASR